MRRGSEKLEIARKAYPAVTNGLLPALATLPNTNDNVETVVARIESLTVALRAVANQSEGVVLEVLLELGEGPVASLVDNLFGASEVKGLDTASLETQPMSLRLFQSKLWGRTWTAGTVLDAVVALPAAARAKREYLADCAAGRTADLAMARRRD